MNCQQLKTFLEEIEFLDSASSLINWNFTKLGLFENPEKESLILIKTKKNLETLLENNVQEILVLLPVKLYQELGWDEKLKSSFAGLALVPSFEKALTTLSYHFYRERMEEGASFFQENSHHIAESAQVHPTAVLGKKVNIGERVIIMPYATIMDNVTIGDDTVIFPHATLYSQVTVGKNCRLHSHSCIGSDGFGYQLIEGKHQKVWHSGGVTLGDDVEVGANTCIDAGTFSPTIIGEGTKIDNQVQIGHNCQVGKYAILCAQVAIGGSSVIGDYCVFGGQAGMADHRSLGSKSQVGGGAGITNSWPEGSVLAGYPARPVKEWLRGLAHVRQQSLRRK